jgi:hypothetical protein
MADVLHFVVSQHFGARVSYVVCFRSFLAFTLPKYTTPYKKCILSKCGANVSILFILDTELNVLAVTWSVSDPPEGIMVVIPNTPGGSRADFHNRRTRRHRRRRSGGSGCCG